MTSLIKNQVLKHLTKFFKDLAPEQLQLSAFKGSCELSNLQLEEKVLMELLSFPAWLGINKATCDQLAIKIPWTKIKSVPIQMNLNEVAVEVEVCDEFRNIDFKEDDINLSNLINSAQAPSKYGFVDRVIDGITVTVNNVLITFKSKLLSATFNLSRVILESRCPNWKQGDLSLTRIKDPVRGQILLFKIVEWQTMRLEAKSLTDPNQAPLRLITNHAQCRLTIKKQLDDCSVSAARIFVIFEDILWVLTFAQFTSAAAFVEYIFSLIKRSPMSTKNTLCESQSAGNSENNQDQSNHSISHPTSFSSNQMPVKPSINSSLSQIQVNEKPMILTGNMSSASLMEQKFLCYDLVETSLHLYIDKVDAHLYDDIETGANSSSRDSGGALQTTLDQIQVDCYPYSRATSDRKHWYKWFDPSPSSRRHWLSSHFAEFDLMQVHRNNIQTEKSIHYENIGMNAHEQTPSVENEQILSLTVLVKIKDYCMNCVATKHSSRSAGLNKFIQTDKDYHMPSEMPSLYLELNYFYYFDAINRMMIYENVPEPLAFMHLSPTKLLFDSPTLVFLNSFHVNLSKAFVHLDELLSVETTAPRIHCRVEILMPQVSLPAKPTSDTSDKSQTTTPASALLIKSGKVILCNSIYEKDILRKLMESIHKLRESPSQPINLGGTYHSNATKRDAPCSGDWSEIWNASLIDGISFRDQHSQLWSLQFEPVWMDFMNHDVDGLSGNQRLEPIVEPVDTSAFIHLRLAPKQKASTDTDLETDKSDDSPKQKRNDRNIISILVSVMDGPILANMDKVQFSFLQRLGMQVEKLLQQVREDASTLIQMDTTIDDNIELNLTAYVKEIKARLILDKKIEFKESTLLDSVEELGDTNTVPDINSMRYNPELSTANYNHYQTDESIKLGDPLSRISYSTNECKPGDVLVAFDVNDNPEGNDDVDECVEVAEDASCLLISSHSPEEGSMANSADHHGIGNQMIGRESVSPNDKLLIDLDGMEQAASLFAKVEMRPSPVPSYQDQSSSSAPRKDSKCQQDSVNETVSYLEVSMSQLMVRRITETKRRQKY